jgi:dihydrofolate reductase
MIKAIMAVDEDWGIGKDGTLPWPANKEDLKQFKDKTTNHVVIMGSNTWNDPCFPAPLKNRANIVVTSNPDKYLNEGAYAAITNDLKQSIIDIADNLSDSSAKDVWIIGGKKLIEACWDIIDEFHLTRIKGSWDCDTFLDFPADDFTLIQGDVTENNEYYIYRRAI